MKPKPTIDPNAAGDEVKRLLAEDGTANAELKDIRSAKATRKEQLKKALTVVWNAFEFGASVNGYSTRKEWAKNFAGVSTRFCEHLIYGRTPSGANKRSLDIAAHVNNVEFNAKEAYCVVAFEQQRELKYQGKRRGSDLSMTEDNNNATQEEYEALEKEDKIVWTHTVREVYGNVIVRVENEDGTMTGKQLVAALHTKMTATLKSMRLWEKDLTKEFNALVKDTADWHEERAEVRSRGAKKAAQTRAKKKPTAPAYCLPKTEKEFQAEHDKATGEFHKVLAEGEASGVLTTAPREKKPKVTLVVSENCPTEEEV